MLTTLRLAELYQRWDLYASLLRYFRDAGARLGRVGDVYFMEVPPLERT